MLGYEKLSLLSWVVFIERVANYHDLGVLNIAKCNELVIRSSEVLYTTSKCFQKPQPTIME